MADMLDPSIAEQLARSTKQIATNTGMIKGNMLSASSTMAVLNTRMQALIGHTTGAASAARDLAKSLGAVGVDTKKLVDSTNDVHEAASKVPDEINKSSKSFTFLMNAIKGTTAFILSDMIVSLQKLHSVGFAPTEVAVEGIRAQWSQLGLLVDGMPTSLHTIVGAQINMAEQLGGTHMSTTGMVEDVAKLNTLYGISTEVGSKFEAMIYRWSDGSQEVVKHTLDFAYGLSKASGVPIGSILKDAADNAGILARYGAKGVDAFMAQAVELRRMGTTMREMSQFSDKLVDDFTGTLTATAKIQTFLPGFNMAGVQFAAQFGTELDVARELQSSLQSSGLKDLNQLPRSLRNMLTSSLGLSQEAIQNLMHPISAKEKENMSGLDVKHFDNGIEKLSNVIRIGFITLIGLLAVKLGGNVLGAVLSGKGVPGGLNSRLMARIGGDGIGAGLMRKFLGLEVAKTAVAETAAAASTTTAATISGATQLAGAAEPVAAAAAAVETTAAASATSIFARALGVAGKAIIPIVKFLGHAALIVDVGMALWDFYKGMRDGLGVLKSLGNALAGFLTFGLFQPFKKVEKSAGEVARANEAAAKSTQAFNDRLSAVGVQNKDFATAVHDASHGKLPIAGTMAAHSLSGGTHYLQPGVNPSLMEVLPPTKQDNETSDSSLSTAISKAQMPPTSDANAAALTDSLTMLSNTMTKSFTTLSNQKQTVVVHSMMDGKMVGKGLATFYKFGTPITP